MPVAKYYELSQPIRYNYESGFLVCVAPEHSSGLHLSAGGDHHWCEHIQEALDDPAVNSGFYEAMLHLFTIGSEVSLMVPAMPTVALFEKISLLAYSTSGKTVDSAEVFTVNTTLGIYSKGDTIGGLRAMYLAYFESVLATRDALRICSSRTHSVTAHRKLKDALKQDGSAKLAMLYSIYKTNRCFTCLKSSSELSVSMDDDLIPEPEPSPW